MIVTLTINPAIDRIVTADRLVFDDRAYIQSSREAAGGRGIHSASVIHAFGGKTRAIVTAGGAAGAKLEQFLGQAGFPFDIAPVSGETRTNLTITDRNGLTVKLNEPGLPMDRTELARLERLVRTRLKGAEWLMLCGSVPPGVPSNYYARLIAIARERKVQTLLDTDGDALREGIEAGPTVVRPNQQEAERLLDAALITRSHFLDAVARIRKMGAESVILSLGSRGAVAAFEKKTIEAFPPRVDVLCPIGAGDAMGAAFVWARREGRSFEDSLRLGVAAGTASAMLPGITFASAVATGEMYKQVEVRA